MHLSKFSFHLISLFCVVINSSSYADQYTPTPDCVFAVITQKKGLASGLAHNHFISHKFDGLTIEVDPSRPLSTKFVYDFDVRSLTFDDFAQAEKWLLGISGIEGLSAIFSKISQDDRDEIKKHAFAADQLNVDKYPTGRIELKSLSETSQNGFERFKNTAIAELTIGGKTSPIQMALNFSLDGSNLNFEGISKTSFSSFGIKPYSAFLGAVGNQDQFFIYTNCKSTRLSK